MTDGFPTTPVGLGFITATVNALSAAQAGVNKAAGTAAILPAEPSRRAIKIVPPVDCFYAIEPGATSGMPLYGEICNSFEGPECPTNALYIGGLSANAKVVIWKA